SRRGGRRSRFGGKGKKRAGRLVAQRRRAKHSKARIQIHSESRSQIEMTRYISLRLVYSLPALWLIVTMVFLLAHIVPGDPVQQMLGEGATASDLIQLRHAL